MKETSFYINSDKSLLVKINEEGNFIVESNHSNTKNSNTLISNFYKIATINESKNKFELKLKDIPYATISKRNSSVENNHLLTSFETKLLAQSTNLDKIPFSRLENAPKVKTDLHTHFAGFLSPEQLIECGLSCNINIDKYSLDIAKIDTKNLKEQDNGKYNLRDVVSNFSNKQKLINAMKIDTSEQETFNKMEEIYKVRGVFTKNKEMFVPMLKAIAKDCKANGVSYTELSLSSVISDINQVNLLNEIMPKIEKETGVKIRFLGALWRHSDKEWNQDEVDRLKVMQSSPYVVGCDVMGHETNSTLEFYDEIKELAKHAILNDPNFVIRVHAGENALFKANARQVLLAVEEAYYELGGYENNKLKFPQVRIGHGIYGFNEDAPWDENERTKGISTLDLCKKIDPIIEFNMSSNLSLNNINSLKEIPIKSYMDNNIRVVLGTDGKGIYSTDLNQEVILAMQAGLTKDDINKIVKTENEIIKKADERYKNKSKTFNFEKVKSELTSCYRNGKPAYSQDVAKKNRLIDLQTKRDLLYKIHDIEAITDEKQISEDLKGKKPIMISGSSTKHWVKISDKNKTKIQVLLYAFANCIDPKKAYFMTGGTNHGVEKELHQIVYNLNKDNKDKIMVLGTLTKEAIRERETNSIEKNTISHAVIPRLNGKYADRWFDLPDTTLNMLQEQNGMLVAIGGGAIVSDIIQRSHNMGLNMKIMDNVEGASGEKSNSLKGNGYSFNNIVELVGSMVKENSDLLKEGLTKDDLYRYVEEAKTIFCKEQIKESNQKVETKNL